MYPKRQKKRIYFFFFLVLYKLFIYVYNCNQYQEAFKFSPEKNLSKVNSLDIVFVTERRLILPRKTSPR